MGVVHDSPTHVRIGAYWPTADTCLDAEIKWAAVLFGGSQLAPKYPDLETRRGDCALLYVHGTPVLAQKRFDQESLLGLQDIAIPGVTDPIRCGGLYSLSTDCADGILDHDRTERYARINLTGSQPVELVWKRFVTVTEHVRSGRALREAVRLFTERLSQGESPDAASLFARNDASVVEIVAEMSGYLPFQSHQVRQGLSR